ncbi:MAG: DUF1570 domain-containing protein [Planctomycetota bacterium]
MVHEATHQIAFNTGIHSRFAPMPRWFTEGSCGALEMRWRVMRREQTQTFGSMSSRWQRQLRRLIRITPR